MFVAKLLLLQRIIEQNFSARLAKSLSTILGRLAPPPPPDALTILVYEYIWVMNFEEPFRRERHRRHVVPSHSNEYYVM
jgi:hypothetical protein